jgi:ADP-ribose pyrophosphatase YjhB (NUDIX family)
VTDPIRFCPRCGHALTEDMRFNRLHPVCAACGYIHFANPKVAAVVFIQDGSRVLLIKRAVDPERGKWALPGGFVDFGEDPRLAAVREAAEETGLIVELGALLDVMFGGVTIVIAYAARVIGGTLSAADDVEEARWFTPGDLPELAFESTERLISRWIGDLHTPEDSVGKP